MHHLSFPDGARPDRSSRVSFVRTALRPKPLSVPGLAAWLTAVVLLLAAPGWGATPVEKKPASNSATKPKAKFLQEDFPAQAACISAKFPAGNTAMKGQAIRLDHDAAVLFDPDLLRMAAGWTGGFITTHGVAFEGGHAAHPAIVGDQKFGLRQMPGWADARGSFTDCRAEPFGPLPVEWCRWEGHYVVGNDVVLAYSVLGTRIHEQPSSVEQGGQVGFVRTFRTEKARQDLATILCEVEGASGEVRGNIATLTLGTNVTRVGLVDAPRTARLQIVERTRIVLKLPRGTAAGLFKVVVWSGDAAGQASFARLLEGKPRMADIAKGGPSHWPDAVVTQGVLNTSTTPDGAYATDSITAPTDNPWKRRIRFAGLDFFADGKRAALCTHTATCGS